MKVPRKKLPNSILRVDEGFATLMNVLDDGSYIYEFRFYSATAQALNVLASTVKVTIRESLPVSKPNVLKNAGILGDAHGFVIDVLTAPARAKDTQRDNVASALSSARVDLTAKFNNDLTKTFGDPVTTSQLGTQRLINLQSVTDLKKQNLNPPVLQTKGDPAPVTPPGQYQLVATDLLSRGIDPSVAGTKQTSVRGTHSAFSGVGMIDPDIGANSTNASSPITGLKAKLAAAFHTNVPQQFDARLHFADATLVPIISDIPIRQLSNTRVMRVPPSIGTRDFYVVFELVDVTGRVLESITRRVEHGKLVKVFNTPKVPPRISIAQFQFPGKNVIEMRQSDPRANRVRLLRRRVSRAEINIAESKYEFVTEVPLKARDGLLKFIDPVNNSSVIQYRCIPIGPGGIIGSEFSNAVSPAIRPLTVERYHRSNAAAISTRIVNRGIEIAVLSIPKGVVSVAIMRRDSTVHDMLPLFLSINQPIMQVGAGLANLVFLDPVENLKEDHIYEYTCVAYFDDGTRLDTTAYSMIRYVPLVPGGVTIEISNLEIVRDSVALDVRFNIVSNVAQTDLDAIRSALIKQGLADFYRDDVLVDRDKFQQLIAHSVSRIDLTTGIQQDFVTFNGTNFSDVTIGRKTGTLRLREGHKYRYVVSTLLRDPETVLPSFIKTLQDDSTGKAYSFLPSKFRHPITLNRGTIVTAETLVSNHPEDAFSFGRVGNVKEVDVTIDVLPPKVTDVKATRVDRRQASVLWSTDGDIDRIDHFVVVKENMGHSSIVGKMHNVSQGKVFEFFDRLQPDDIGEINYRVCPVLNTFEKCAEVSSNKLRINDARGALGGL